VYMRDFVVVYSDKHHCQRSSTLRGMIPSPIPFTDGPRPYMIDIG